jgi:hypothetical protein
MDGGGGLKGQNNYQFHPEKFPNSCKPTQRKL